MITKRKYPWFAEQTWTDILFLHWRVSPEQLSPLIPSPLLLDLYDNSAWISIVSFQAKQSRLRRLEKIQFPTFHQINVRTYVKLPGNSEPGVYFFSLHVNHLLAVLGAKTLYSLPFISTSTVYKKDEGRRYVNSHTKEGFRFTTIFEPQQAAIKEKDVATFLTERYCIWNRKGNRFIKIPIIHSHWHLQQVSIHYLYHPLLEDPTTAHFAVHQRARIFPYETVLVLND